MDNKNSELYENINNIIDNEIGILLNQKIKKKKEILILSGGYLKGIAQLGALHCLKKNKLLNDITTIAGTSVGSMVGMFLCAGFQPMECFKFFQKLHFSKIKKMEPQNVIIKYGFDDGSRTILVLEKLLSSKGFSKDINFKEFFNKTQINFIITGACVNDKKTYYFSHINYPNMKIIEAIRISISLPILFTPCVFEGKLFVDGGCTDNFPIHLFDNDLDKVIGIYTTETRQNTKEIKFIEDYILNTIYCIFDGMVKNNIKNYENYIIKIHCSNVSESEQDLINMFDQGFNTANKKIESGAI